MKFKLNPLTGEFDYTSESANKQKLNPLTWEFNLVEGDGPFSQIFNPLTWTFNLGTRGGWWIIAEVTGNWYINLTNAVANHLMELKAYWWTEQNGTPTPTTPVDIVCNNWTIKFSKNMANVNSQTALVWYYISAQWQVLESPYNRIYQEYIPCKPNTKYTISMSNAIYYISISEYSTAGDSGFIRRSAGSTGGNTQLTITTRSNTNYLRFGANLSSSDITIDDVLAINWQLEEWDTPTQYKPYVEWGIYVEWTTETIEDELWNTATAEMLLKIWDYVDEQEILSWDIIRKVGVYVYDGTESFTEMSTPNSFRFGFNSRGMAGVNPICSHYPAATITLSAANMPDQAIKGHATAANSFYLKDSRFDTKEELKAWLAAQYAAWTPVIVLYVLETETTESVAGQTMNIPAWNSLIEITQASIDNLPLYAKYLQSN